jgi:hypothetical protein
VVGNNIGGGKVEPTFQIAGGNFQRGEEGIVVAERSLEHVPLVWDFGVLI